MSNTDTNTDIMKTLYLDKLSAQQLQGLLPCGSAATWIAIKQRIKDLQQ